MLTTTNHPNSFADVEQTRPILGHVGLMVDTLISNASLEELRSFARATLASSTPTVTAAFTAAARSHLAKIRATQSLTAGTLFHHDGDVWRPTEELPKILERCRVLYGAGMGVAALTLLKEVVEKSVGVRWEEDSPVEQALAAIDADLCQAIQSAKEELDRAGEKDSDVEAAREAREKLRSALMASKHEVEEWEGDFPFESALWSVDLWKL
ncbi:hypothetical protein PYCCODRAFT_1466404 [Trametes coccinea BRFM310]|uniref:Uncharacterized protein n=1 Tax=Trametes coccinea (strain BRFM310) TaxID=1353009 RepID=A0A1Y2IS20_TRAC3|nr:hypothetical protein PYCCODRAFT_1466404 [Trametes coccinea BRFM310]